MQKEKPILIFRSGALRHWEPIFIGTNKDPTYDERLSWEGRADKMVMRMMMMTMMKVMNMDDHDDEYVSFALNRV